MSTPFSAFSTPEDMLRWNEALAHPGKLLNADSLKQMFTEYPEAEHERQHHGYGVVISGQKFAKLLYYHGGGIEGFSSSIQRYPDGMRASTSPVAGLTTSCHSAAWSAATAHLCN